MMIEMTDAEVYAAVNEYFDDLDRDMSAMWKNSTMYIRRHHALGIDMICSIRDGKKSSTAVVHVNPEKRYVTSDIANGRTYF